MRWFVAVGLLACGGKAEQVSQVAPEEPMPMSAERQTQAGLYTVKVTSSPEIPKMGELFTVQAVVTDRYDRPMEGGKVILDARMPHHNHGMETKPIEDEGTCDDEGVCLHPGGVFTSEGFKFHMGGEWTITIAVNGPLGTDTTSFVYEML